MRMRARVAVLAVALAIVAGVAACGLATTSPTTVTCVNIAATDTPALQAAITAAGANAGTVSIGAGHCAIDARLIVTKPETISGAGQHQTFLTSATGFGGISVKFAASPFTLAKLSIDTATNNPGTYRGIPGCSDSKGVVLTSQPGAFYSEAPNTTIAHVTAAVSCAFGLRVVAGSHAAPCSADLQHGTVVNDLTVSNIPAGGGFAALDISCTNGATLTKINVHGNYIALYYDRNITLNGETYAHGLGRCQQPFAISAPSDHIAVSNVTSDAGPGAFYTANGATNSADTVTADSYSLTCPPINGP